MENINNNDCYLYLQIYFKYIMLNYFKPLKILMFLTIYIILTAQVSHYR